MDEVDLSVMTLMTVATVVKKRSFFPSSRSSLAAGFVVSLALAAAGAQVAPAPTTPTQSQAPAQTQTSPDGSQTTSTGTTTDSSGKPATTTTTSRIFSRGRKKDDKVVQSKDTKKELDRVKKDDVLIGQDSKLPDKQLYDKSLAAMKKGHFDVARLDLQTMLNTYPDSQYQMRAKLAIADSWYREGGTAALTQAESEYADFRVFFPNVPEAAEAQMRIGDIYFRQMDKPDRDYAKALHAEEEYRRMLTDYPDSPLVPQARQRLREVQEVMATREADIAAYYATRENWAAVIARDQTIINTYPLYSHVDDVLIGLGDAYEAQARYLRGLTLPEGGKAKLLALYDGQAAEAYRRVVLEHSAAPHVEDAKDRLAAMNLPIPTPTRDQVAASEALENSRAQYRLVDFAKSFLLHSPDVVTAARIGEPSLTDPKPVLAPTIVHNAESNFKGAFNTAAAPSPGPVAPAAAPAADAVAPADTSAPAAPLAFVPVASADAASGTTGATTFSPAAPAAGTGGTHTGVGIEIVSPAAPATTTARPTSTTGDTTGGLTAVGPKNAAPLPEAEAAAPAPDRPNDAPAATPPAQTPGAKGKTTPPKYDKSDESSSKHKPKKGIKKALDPL